MIGVEARCAAGRGQAMPSAIARSLASPLCFEQKEMRTLERRTVGDRDAFGRRQCGSADVHREACRRRGEGHAVDRRDRVAAGLGRRNRGGACSALRPRPHRSAFGQCGGESLLRRHGRCEVCRGDGRVQANCEAPPGDGTPFSGSRAASLTMTALAEVKA